MAYVRPTAMHYTFVRNATVYYVTADLHNRRITLTWGRLGATGRTLVHTFTTREEARDFLDGIVERREALGYSQVA